MSKRFASVPQHLRWLSHSISAAFLMAAPAASAGDAPTSGDGVTTIDVRSEEIGMFSGVAFRRYHGILHGSVAADEDVAGLQVVLAGRSFLPYAAAFELITPVVPQPQSAVVVEVENRGRPAFLARLANMSLGGKVAPDAISYPDGLGNGFPFRSGVAYGRVAWQNGIAPTIPQHAQGVGEVILRQFGQLLAAGGAKPANDPLPVFDHRVIIGESQSAWTVNTFISEGFNRNPATGHSVYEAAFTRDGVGNVLAINHVAQGGEQFPYLRPDAVPLRPTELLSRPSSDPLLVDIAAYTDYYRLRASLFAQAQRVSGLYRYAVAAAHAPAAGASNSLVFGTLHCNGGQEMPLSTIDDTAQDRAILTALLKRVGTAGLGSGNLPPERMFTLVAPGAAPLNGLPGYAIRVPKTDTAGMPVGGVPMLEQTLPLGRPVPPAVPPVSTRSITDVCGNFGGWQRYTRKELIQRYGSLQNYLVMAIAQQARQQSEGFLLPADSAAEMARITRSARTAFDED